MNKHNGQIVWKIVGTKWDDSLHNLQCIKVSSRVVERSGFKGDNLIIQIHRFQAVFFVDIRDFYGVVVVVAIEHSPL